MSARGEPAKMGGEGASPKPDRGTDVSGKGGGWVLDESGWRVGAEEAGEGRNQGISSTAGGPHPVKRLPPRPVPRTSTLAVASIGFAALSLIFLLTGQYVFTRIGFFLPLAAVANGVFALVRIRQSGGALWERWFAVLGILVGASMTLFLALILWAVSEGGLVPCFDAMSCA